MSFDLNEAVFDEQGTYLEEPALRYEHALMDQFAASPEGQAIKETGVLPHSVVDNSDFSPTRLTAWETRLMLASQGVLPSPHFKRRGIV